MLSQESSHTVPHRLFIQTSTLPSFGMLPPTSRNWPVVQTAERNRRNYVHLSIVKSCSTNFVWFHHLLFLNSVSCMWSTVIKPVSADVSSKFIALQPLVSQLMVILLGSVFYTDISITNCAYHKPRHLTPASSEWLLVQLTEGLWEQSMSLLSLPLQSTPSRWIAPVPAPKWALPKAIESVGDKV